MSYNCCSGNFSSRSCGGDLQYPSSSCGSSYPSNLVYSTNVCSSGNYQPGSSYLSGCRETCYEPTSCHRSYVVSSPCQTSCYRPRFSTICSPCQTTYSGSQGFGSISCCSRGYGSRSCYSSGCGASGFRSLGYGDCGFPSVGYESSLACPRYLLSGSYQSSCYRPTCGSRFYQSTC